MFWYESPSIHNCMHTCIHACKLCMQIKKERFGALHICRILYSPVDRWRLEKLCYASTKFGDLHPGLPVPVPARAGFGISSRNRSRGCAGTGVWNLWQDYKRGLQYTRLRQESVQYSHAAHQPPPLRPNPHPHRHRSSRPPV